MVKSGPSPANQDWVISSQASFQYFQAPWILSPTLTHNKTNPAGPQTPQEQKSPGSLLCL